jgi:hypothetical protein
VIRNYRLQKFDESGQLVPGKVFGVCETCLPEVEKKISGDQVLTPASFDKSHHSCFRCKQSEQPAETVPPTAGAFYNTTEISGETLAERIAAAKTQDIAVLTWFRAHPNDGFTRDEIHRCVVPNAPITSAGRAMNTLMEAGMITKTSEFRDGEYGARQHIWRLTK